MDSALFAEVKVAVELSMKGDAQSVAAADNWLGKTLPDKVGFLPALFMLAVDQGVSSTDQADKGVRKAAAIIFGKEIKFNWKKAEETARQYAESDKQLIRDHYFEGLIRCNEQDIVKLLGHALYFILSKDLDTWTNYEDLVMATMTQNPTHESIYCALVGLHALAKVRQYCVDEDRDSIETTSRKFFPTLLELGNTLAKDLNLVNALLAKELAKVYFRTTRMDLSPYFRDFQVNDSWMSLLDKLFVQSVVALRHLHESKASEHVYFASPYWNILKWVLRIIKRYTYRYGDPNLEEEKFEPFAKHWMQVNSVTYWERLVEVINNRKAIRVPEKVVVLCVSILFNLFGSDAVIQKHEASFESFLLDSMFDLLKFTKEDEELYNDNPVEYFRKNDSENSPNFGPAGQALNVFGKSFKHKKYLKMFMKFVNECLSSGTNPRTKHPVTVIEKEVFFHIIETNTMYILKIKNCADMIAGLLVNFVEPELSSPHGFMRMRACKMVTNYGSSTLGLDLLKKLSEGVVKCMKDNELPVKSCAAQALETLLKKQELRDFFLPELKGLLMTYILLINEFENDTLIGSLKGIFELYSEVIGPYALDLAKNLSELFFKCLDKEKKAQEADDDTSEKEKEVMDSGFACQGCLVAIEEILHSNIDKTILPAFFEIVQPIFEYTFSEEGLDFMSESASILNMFVYSFETIPDGMWSYFVVVCYALMGKPKDLFPDFPAWTKPKIKEIFNNMPAEDFATEFFTDLSPILRNFINKGDPIIFTQNDFYNQTLIELLLKTIVDVLKKSLPQAYSGNELADGLTLGGYTFAQLPGKLGPYLGRLLDVSIEAISERRDLLVKDCFIHNLGFAMWNNTTATLEHLNSKGLLNQVLASWPDQHRKAATYRARKASFIGMLSLFSLTTEQLQAAKIPILPIYTLMMEDLPRLVVDQEKAMNAAYEDSDDDFGDFHDDEDEDDLLDVDLDEPDALEHHPKSHADKKSLDSKIKNTHKKLDALNKASEDEKMERQEAKEGFCELENHSFNDNSDKLNEILLFESTLSSTLMLSRPDQNEPRAIQGAGGRDFG